MSDVQRCLRLAMEAAHMAIWDFHIVNGNLEEGSVYWSAQGAALLGLKARPLSQSFDAFLKLVHRDDRRRVVGILRDGVARRGEYGLEYRVVWPGGTVRWLAARARVFSGADGKPERTLGIVWDITERMNDELLTDECKELAEVTLGSIGDGVITTDTRKLAEQLSWQATHDSLTGLINRREFETQVAAALHASKQEDHVHALLYLDLDLDRFKTINDTSGHGAGDVLLQLLAKLLLQQLRDSDILARLGGDELGVLLPHCPPDQARLIADAIRQSIRDFRFAWDARTFELGVSIGLVEIDRDSKSMSELLSAADQACCLAKEQGSNRIHVHRESDLMLARRHGEMMWVSRLNDAFERRYFRLYAMPIVHLQRPSESHDEVLIRIQNGKGDLILPGAFIPAAERYDLMASIDRWVIKTVCRHVKSVRDSLPLLAAFEETHRRSPALYSINLSGVSLNDAGLQDYITEQFVQYEIAPEQICFEITETAVIANLPKAQTFMSGLKTLGCRFSLDDFGSGFSSFGYLKALPVDYLKIDGIFVRDIASNAINRAMVKAINEVSHVMRIQTVAEYVEDLATLSVVRDIGVDYAQGYAVGSLRPLTPGLD